MPKNVSRPGICAVQLRTQHCSQVADADLHGIRGRSLCLSTYVDCRPAENQRDGRVYSDSGKEGSNVGNTWPCLGIGVREQDNVSDDRNGGSREDEECTTCIALRKYRPENREDCRDRIRWDGKKLRLG